MLTLTRRPGQRVRLLVGGVTVWLAVDFGSRPDTIRLSVDAPRDLCVVDREEILPNPLPEGRGS